MRKANLRKMLAALVCIACLMCGVTAVNAEKSTSLKLSATIAVQGVATRRFDYRVRLMADDDTCPMPDGKMGGFAEITITGAGKGEFGEIVYSHAGVYSYRILQTSGKAKSCNYDSRVYTMTVTVLEDADGNLTREVGVRTPAGVKVDDVIFTNCYPEGTGSGTLTKTGDSGMMMVYGAAALLLMAAAVMIAAKIRKNYGKNS